MSPEPFSEGNPAPQCGGNAVPRCGENNVPSRRSGERCSQEPSQHNRGWYSRGYLPHFDSPYVLQHITYRLIDSLPHEVLQQMHADVQALSDENARNTEIRRRIEELLDAGYGSCVLAEPTVAACVLGTWFHFDGVRYRLLEWVVTPNHCHVLIEPFEGVPLGKIVLSWKNYTARFINEYLGRSRSAAKGSAAPQSGLNSGPVWQCEYWDRFIRNENHLAAVREYIVMNPVKAGLVKKPEEWPWSSAAYRGVNG